MGFATQKDILTNIFRTFEPYIINYLYLCNEFERRTSRFLLCFTQITRIFSTTNMIENEELMSNDIVENVSAEEPVKRPRRRVIKKDTTDHVYSVNGTDGENLDTKAAKRKAKASTEIFTTATPKEEKVENPFPKHRGRKSKAELEYLASLEQNKTDDSQEVSVMEEGNDVPEYLDAISELNTAVYAEESIQQDEDVPMDEAAEVPMDYPQDYQEEETEEFQQGEYAAGEETEPELPFFPEQAFATGDGNFNNEATDGNLIAQLQAKMNAQNTGNMQEVPEEDFQDEVWEGDPGDGTDFIIVEDIPIEDAGAMMNVDIFDNPTNAPVIDTYAPSVEPIKKPEYDFKDIVKAVGLMEVMPENYGFLRSSDYNYLSSPDDIFVSMQQIRKYGLKTGDVVECMVCPPIAGDKYFTIQEITMINGRDPMDIRDRVPFEHLTPLFPDEKFNLCGNPKTTNLSTRIVDLFSPIGKGQRALIVAQPKTGKTILMKDIANAIASSHPEAYLMILLIDERPEEVTDMARTVNAEVIASTFDEPAERHVKIAGLVLEKAKRMVECGHDVVIFLDSITRLARAYNTVAPASGKVLTGGVDANALQKPKRFFGAARNIEGGGSLTIIATALTDTGSKMDEVIFEEFKGTGNMELQLERSLANKRIFPAVNLIASSTRRDDLLHDKTTLDRMWILRKFISDMNPIEGMNEIHGRMKKTLNNEEFLITMNG